MNTFDFPLHHLIARCHSIKVIDAALLGLGIRPFYTQSVGSWQSVVSISLRVSVLNVTECNGEA